MTQKVLGGAIILGAICLIIFLVKFIPVYLGVGNLDESFSECLANYQQYQEAGCRSYFEAIIKKEGLTLDPQAITIDAELQRPDSIISAHIDEPIDFFGYWTYHYVTDISRKGTPPRRT